MLISSTSIASTCLNIKVVKPVETDNRIGTTQIIKSHQAKLLYKDKSNICLPIQGTYILAYEESIPFIAACIKGHTSKITLISQGGMAYAMVYLMREIIKKY